MFFVIVTPPQFGVVILRLKFESSLKTHSFTGELSPAPLNDTGSRVIVLSSCVRPVTLEIFAVLFNVPTNS